VSVSVDPPRPAFDRQDPAVLHPEDFYRENNGQIYRAALAPVPRAADRQRHPGRQLQTMGLLDRVGGRAQLASMRARCRRRRNRVLRPYRQGEGVQAPVISAGSNIAGSATTTVIEAEEAINQAPSLYSASRTTADQRELSKLYDLLVRRWSGSRCRWRRQGIVGSRPVHDWIG